MAKSKDNKPQASNPSVKVKDLEPQKDPKGGKVKHNPFVITHPIDKPSP